MRKAEKKQASDFLKLLEQAHEQVKKTVGQKNIQAALGILEDCQDGAIALGGMIERSEGEGTETVSLLEEYCELVYQAHEEFAQETDINANKIYKALKQILIKIVNGLNREITVRKEVVFLPYKASMWDSLESVWRAADADPACDAYVIPIPYYDKNPDGSFKELHYEGDLYPQDVPVVSYEEYDFEMLRPDIIFIHNPYDDSNYVTSVEPFFYSDNLKRYTDQLIYIPYFVLGEVDPKNKAVVEGMAHFVTVPAVMNADKVIVQSEDMREVYINIMSSYTGEHTRKIWEDRIIGLGSPKFDKLASVKIEDGDIPKQWKNIIYKLDGSRKKIIFYNTSIGAFLQRSDQYLTKMKDVFRVFREKTEEVALLWRPHPLIQATVGSMRPQIWESYQKLVEEYQNAGWGIYDDSAELDRAIVLSDAYYGDRSSVAYLYQKTNKPLMIQDSYAMSDRNDLLVVDHVVEYEGKWWFLSLKNNGIYRMDKDTYIAELVTHVPFEYTIIDYKCIYIYEDKIFVLPWGAGKIAIYDIKKELFRYLKIENLRNAPFIKAIAAGNRLYLIPNCCNSLWYVDMEQECIHPIIENIETERRDTRSQMFAWGNVIFEDNVLWMTKSYENKILQIDINTARVKQYACDALKEGGAGICSDEKGVWIIPRKADCILYWEKKDQILKKFDNFPKGYHCGEEISFYKAFIDGGNLYLLPYEANMLLVIRTDGIITKLLDKPCENDNYYEKNISYPCIWRNNDALMLFSSKDGNLLEIKDDGTIMSKKVKQLADKQIKDVSVLNIERESMFGDIGCFLNGIIESDMKSLEGDDIQDKMVGNKIWEKLKYSM